MNIVGYAGCEAFDVVLYIGRTLTKLNRRVLIIDVSGSDALCCAIKHGMDLDSTEDIVNYRDINYIRKLPSEQDLEPFKDGVVFVVYGKNYIEDFQLTCNNFTVVVNTFPHEINQVSGLLQKLLRYENNVRLLIRDIISEEDADRVKEQLSALSTTAEYDYLYMDIEDYENAIRCQVTQIVRFTKITSQMEKYIMEQVQLICSDIKPNKIKKAFKLARKGN